jgi:hypothetical protein
MHMLSTLLVVCQKPPHFRSGPALISKVTDSIPRGVNNQVVSEHPQIGAIMDLSPISGAAMKRSSMERTVDQN